MSRHTLFVGGLNPRTRAREVAYEFERFGDLVRCDIPTPSGTSKGFAFVEFIRERDAEDAIRRMQGCEIDGRRITIEWAKREPASGWRRGAPVRDRRDDRRRDGRNDRRSDRRDDRRDDRREDRPEERRDDKEDRRDDKKDEKDDKDVKDVKPEPKVEETNNSEKSSDKPSDDKKRPLDSNDESDSKRRKVDDDAPEVEHVNRDDADANEDPVEEIVVKKDDEEDNPEGAHEENSENSS